MKTLRETFDKYKSVTGMGNLVSRAAKDMNENYDPMFLLLLVEYILIRAYQTCPNNQWKSEFHDLVAHIVSNIKDEKDKNGIH